MSDELLSNNFIFHKFRTLTRFFYIGAAEYNEKSTRDTA